MSFVDIFKLYKDKTDSDNECIKLYNQYHNDNEPKICLQCNYLLLNYPFQHILLLVLIEI